MDIQDIGFYFKDKGTIEEDLKNIKASDKLIMAIHTPPDIGGLDQVSNSTRVGSKAVRQWIEREQPLMVLCNHIHESYHITDVWKVEYGRTTIIQPGQLPGQLHAVIIDISDTTVTSELILI